MPTITDLNLTVVKDVANADITVDYKINWNAFEQATNLEFDEIWQLKGDDTGQDGDNTPTGDDPISLGGLVAIARVASNGQAVTQRTKTRSIAYTNLNEDSGDDEIRAVVTLSPRLPAEASGESNLVTVNA